MENAGDRVEISSAANSATDGGTPDQTGVAPRESMPGFSKKLQPPSLGGATLRVVTQMPTFSVLYIPPKVFPCEVEIWQREDIEVRCRRVPRRGCYIHSLASPL